MASVIPDRWDVEECDSRGHGETPIMAVGNTALLPSSWHAGLLARLYEEVDYSYLDSMQYLQASPHKPAVIASSLISDMQ